MTMPDLAAAGELLRMADLVTPMAIRTAATLRLVDHLGEDGATAEELAGRTGTHPRTLGKLLDHLVAVGIMTEPRPGRFAASGLGALLSAEYDGIGVRPMLDLEHLSGRIEMGLTSLPEAVRTGHAAYEVAHGRSLWEYLDGPDATDADLALFGSPLTVLGADLIVDGYDWSGVKTVVDVGGNTGAVLGLLLTAHPHLSGTLLDLPAFAELGRAHLESLGLSDRATVVGGSFFDPLPTGADVYLLSAILPDWDDEQATRLLRRCAEAAGRDGRVLLAEVHLRATHPDPVQRTAADLRIEVGMEDPGRSLADVTALAAAAGLEVTAEGPARADRSLLELRCAGAGPRSGAAPDRQATGSGRDALK